MCGKHHLVDHEGRVDRVFGDREVANFCFFQISKEKYTHALCPDVQETGLFK